MAKKQLGVIGYISPDSFRRDGSWMGEVGPHIPKKEVLFDDENKTWSGAWTGKYNIHITDNIYGGDKDDYLEVPSDKANPFSANGMRVKYATGIGNEYGLLVQYGIRCNNNDKRSVIGNHKHASFGGHAIAGVEFDWTKYHGTFQGVTQEIPKHRFRMAKMGIISRFGSGGTTGDVFPKNFNTDSSPLFNFTGGVSHNGGGEGQSWHGHSKLMLYNNVEIHHPVGLVFQFHTEGAGHSGATGQGQAQRHYIEFRNMRFITPGDKYIPIPAPKIHGAIPSAPRGPIDLLTY